VLETSWRTRYQETPIHTLQILGEGEVMDINFINIVENRSLLILRNAECLSLVKEEKRDISEHLHNASHPPPPSNRSKGDRKKGESKEKESHLPYRCSVLRPSGKRGQPRTYWSVEGQHIMLNAKKEPDASCVTWRDSWQKPAEKLCRWQLSRPGL